MQVKKRTLYIICPIIVVVLICSYITYSDYERKKAEERDKLELKISFERDCEREYQSLIREYQSIVDVIKDRDYSDRFRFKYVTKLNDILGIHQYEISSGYYSTIQNCIRDLSINEDEDKEILRQKAYQNTYAKWIE
ncbi:MAG: hypothetical protein IJC40_03725 [Muribaculaceae bacterium]|nr:hypothetical protein [Muribaculaceae bacterium]